MLPKNFTLHFYLKKPKQYESGPVFMYMRLTVDGQRSEFSSVRKCESVKWNSDAERFIGNK